MENEEKWNRRFDPNGSVVLIKTFRADTKVKNRIIKGAGSIVIDRGAT